MQTINSKYRGARLIVPRFWNSKFERIRGIWMIEPLRGLLIEHHSKKGYEREKVKVAYLLLHFQCFTSK